MPCGRRTGSSRGWLLVGLLGMAIAGVGLVLPAGKAQGGWFLAGGLVGFGGLLASGFLTLVTTLSLYLLSMVLVLTFEWTNPATLAGLGPVDRLLNAAYHGFMARSCGMNVIDMTDMTEETLLITYGLMMIGGGSASTAGGLKVTTVAILLLAVWHQARGDADITAFGRRVSATVQREALSVLVLAFGVLGVGVMALRLLSDLPLRQVVFEAISAFANVGLSMNSTPNLPPAAQLVVIVLMFLGRVGTITVAVALALRSRQSNFRYPEERPIVG